MIKPPHPTISCESVIAIILQNKRQNTRNTSKIILSIKHRYNKEYCTVCPKSPKKLKTISVFEKHDYKFF